MKNLTLLAAIFLLASCTKENLQVTPTKQDDPFVPQMAGKAPTINDTVLMITWCDGYNWQHGINQLPVVYDTVYVFPNKNNQRHYTQGKDIINVYKSSNDLFVNRDGYTLGSVFTTFKDQGYYTRIKLRTRRPADTANLSLLTFYAKNLKGYIILLQDKINQAGIKVYPEGYTVYPFVPKVKVEDFDIVIYKNAFEH